MQTTIPIYNAVLEGETDGITCVSLVDRPAVEADFLRFAKQTFAISENHLIGVLLRADYPIYRNDKDGEYYIKFQRKEIETIAMRFHQQPKTASLMHNGQLIEGINLVSLFVKDTARGIAPKDFDDVADGSLFGVYEVANAQVLARIKSGEIRGFSIEGYFGKQKTKFNNMNIAKKLLLKFLDETKAIKVDDGTTIIAADGGEIAEGKEVAYIERDETVANGEYQWGEKVVKIESGKVVEIREEEEETAPTTALTEVTREDLDAIITRIEHIEKVIFPNEPQQTDLKKTIKTILGRN